MNILHLNNEKTWRGGERQVLITAVEQCRTGHNCRIACRRGSPLEAAAKAEGVPTIGLPTFAPAILLALAREAGACEVLHCHTGRAHSLAVMTCMLRSKPLVVSRRVDFLPRKTWFNKLKYRRVGKLVCVSRYIADQLVRWGVPASQVEVIYEAVPDAQWASRSECLKALAEHVTIGPGQKIVGNIAALVPHKDQATLLRAAQRVAKQRSDVAFVIVGDGELRAALLRLRTELGLDKQVHFAGFIPKAQRLLPAFEVFAMSSSMEGLGTSVLDANLAGVPVAATAGGGLPEIVGHNETGLLAPVGDADGLAGAILKLLSDAPLAARLAEAARARTRSKFAPSVMASQYVELYRALLGAGGSGASAVARSL